MTAASQIKLRLQQLQHRYMLEEVLVDINLTLATNETIALVGPSGCGKTTLLNIIAKLIEPAAGEMYNAFQQQAVVFQQPRLLPWKTTLDNIALGLKARGIAKAQRQQQAAAMALSLGLAAEDLTKYPAELSGGMQSRVALARALVLAPDLLLLDEPFAALDFALKLELYQLLQQQLDQLGGSAIIITHDLMEALRLADRILLMQANPGQIVQEIQVADLLANSATNGSLDAGADWQIYHALEQLLQQPKVRQAFAMPALATSD